MNDFAMSPESVELGRPTPITSDVVIQFRGEGPARFRVQHARDAGGMPDDLSWCDVSALSNRNAAPRKMVIIDDKKEQRGGIVRGVLVDQVDGDQDAFYRRHTAGWLRVIPFDEEDREQCQTYSISIYPMDAA